MRWLKRQYSITSLFTIATLAPLVVVGVVLLTLAVRTANQSTISLGGDILEESARRVDADIKKYLDQTVRVSDLFDGLIKDGVLPTTSYDQWRERLFIRLRVTPEVSSICFTNETLDTIYLMRYPPDLELGEAVGHRDGSTLRTFVARSDGTVNPEPKQTYEYDPRDRPWWIAGWNAPTPVWTEPYEWFVLPERKGESVVAIAYTRTVRDRRGNRLGVLSLDATLEEVNHYLAATLRTPGAFIAVTDLQDRLIASSFGKTGKVLRPVAAMNDNDEQIQRDAAAILERTRDSRDAFSRVALDGRTYLVRKAPITLNRGPVWRVTLAIPDDQLLREARNAVNWMKILGILSLSLAAGTAILLARSVTRPLRELAAFAHEIGTGKFHQRVESRSAAELDELAQALNNMAANLAERVHILAQRDAAQEASAVKARLIAHVSHEFRTPLNAIIGYAEMVKEDAHAKGLARTEQDVGNILVASRHLLTLINNLLDLSRVEAGKMRLDVVDFSVQSLVREIVQTVRPVVEENQNAFEIVLPEHEVQMKSDPPRLKQILINLLGNAAKFTAGGKISLKVEADAGEVRFHVSDTGQGMTPDQLKRLFEPFGQVHASIRSPKSGAGLGLAITKQLTQLLGGTIEVQSEPAMGTRALLKIPRFHRDHPPESLP